MTLNNRVKTKRIHGSLFLCGIAFSCISVFAMDTAYRPNVTINDSRKKILAIFTQIEAQSSIGTDIDTDVFTDLSNLFRQVFPKLPQKNTFVVTYQQCQILVDELRVSFAYPRFKVFMDKCHAQLSKVIGDINTNYTIKTDIKASPAAGSAPLTVTLDARGSRDPSNVTIPNTNYYRRYKDIDGKDKAIGQGSVINHLFDTEGTYYVNLTVKSANGSQLGILDGEQIIPITVSPQAAVITIYANGEKLDPGVHTKIGTREARNGVNFDASATVPQGGRVILRHVREVTSERGFRFRSKEQTGAPSFIELALPDNGDYQVTLTTTDNENNVIKGVFLVKVSDPISLITQSPDVGTTTTEFSFDSRKSYSIQSRIKTVTRDVFDSEGGRLFTTQKSDIKRTFPKPGPYNVKLTITDEAGETDSQTQTIVIESTPPVAQFSYEPTSQRERSSQFVFDAGKSSDLDRDNGNDELSYSRNFGQSGQYVVEKGTLTDSQVIVSFDTMGAMPVTLTVTDSFGKSSTKTETVDVKSSLRPVIVASPRATTFAEPIDFVVRTNSDSVVNIDRDFGDGTTMKTTNNSIQHTYASVGTYTAKVRVTTRNNDENIALLDVFVGQKDSPIGVIKIVDRFQNIMKQREECEDPDISGTVPAYSVVRYEEIKFDMTESLTIAGQRNNGLKYYYQPKDNEIFTKQNFSYKFTEMGCRYIDVTIEDTAANRFDKRRVWFKVFNALPVLDNIKLGFPQFGNDVGVGFQQNQARDILYTKFDPLTVKVEAVRPADFDGFISYFTWYYYDRNNPDRILESKVSPSTSPYAFFSLPTTIPGEYVFGVRITDNDGGELSSEELIGQSSMVAFFPDSRNIDIPLVTLIPDKINIKAGEEVTFTVKSRILSQRKDFDAQKTIRYDFDGDGVIDLVTKDEVVKYMYKEPIEDGIIPKVEVIYRGYKGTAFGERITIAPGLRPILYLSTAGNTVIVRDLSVGSITDKAICFDRRVCEKDPDYLKKEGNLFVFSYPSTGSYVLEYSIKDDYGNEATERRVVDIQGLTTKDYVQVASIPEMEIVDEVYRVRIGDNMANAILFHVAYQNYDGGDCFLDADIEIDTNKDGVLDNDRDVECNIPNTLIRYTPKAMNSTARLYYQVPDELNGGTKTEFRDILVEFLDQGVAMTPEDKKKYESITAIITAIDTSLSGENQRLVNELLNLRSNIQSKLDVATSLVVIDDMISQREAGGILIDDDVVAMIDAMTKEFSDGSIVAALGGTEYEQAKQEILSIAPQGLKSQLSEYFVRIEAIENPDLNKEGVKKELDMMIKFLLDHTTIDYETQGDDQILQEDLDLIVLPSVCQILGYFEIESAQCGPTPEQTAEAVVETTSSGVGTIVKRILIVLVVVGLGFVGLVSFFAIKAKQKEAA